MSTYTAANRLTRLVRNFAQRQPAWAECVVYDTKPDERWNLGLVCYRVYGTWDEFIVIQAAAGLDSVEFELTDRTLVLPTRRQLDAMKALAGFNTDPWNRTPAQTADPVGTR